MSVTKKRKTGENYTWDDQLSWLHIRGRLAVASAGLQGKGLRKRHVVCSQTPVRHAMHRDLGRHVGALELREAAAHALVRLEHHKAGAGLEEACGDDYSFCTYNIISPP